MHTSSNYWTITKYRLQYITAGPDKMLRVPSNLKTKYLESGRAYNKGSRENPMVLN